VVVTVVVGRGTVVVVVLLLGVVVVGIGTTGAVEAVGVVFALAA
jgi:hypothetical protein